MKIAVVGPIFHKSERDRSALQPTTETMLADGLEEAGHEVVRLSPRELIRGARAARDASVDAIHIHHPSVLTTLLAFVPARSPVIYTPHRTNMPPKWRQKVGHRRLLKGADVIVTLSPLERDHAIDVWAVSADRIVVIPNGFSSEDFAFESRSAPGPKENWTLLFVGQLIEPKQPGALLEAIDDPRLRNVQVRFVSHNPRLQNVLSHEAEERGLSDRVVFVGQRHGSALADEYRQAHFLVLPSKDLEALPSVITEAMFTGLPVVAGDVGGIRWQLDGAGQVIRNIDPPRLRNALLHAMSQYEKALAAARFGAEHARATFARERMIERHIDLYRNLGSG